ncbi:hypothetical protein VEJY3_06285 [Vibrio sp. EJY3]|nr:hypothetical protein VEJY3_06285 [Vibrio sp. EJY3]
MMMESKLGSSGLTSIIFFEVKMQQVDNRKEPFEKLSAIHGIYINFLSFVPFDVADSHLFEGKQNAYRVSENGSIVEIRFQRIYQQQPGIYAISYAPGGKLDVDRYGQLSRTNVTVCLTPKILESNGIEESDLTNGKATDILLELALRYFSRFTDAYRESTGQFWVSVPSKSEVVSCLIQVQYFSGEAIDIMSPLLAPVNFSGGKGHFISPEQDRVLRAKFGSGEKDQVSQLLLSAQGFEHSEQYELVIIQCAIAFEFYIYNRINELTSKTQIKKQTKKPECGCHTGVNQLCETGLKALFKVDFGATDQFTHLSENILKVRNRIVHGDSTVSVTKTAATEAISVTKQAIDWLENRFRDLKI